MNILSRYIRKAVRARGFDMIHYAPWENLFARFGIDLILDVGANAGQSYDSFRWAGFKGPICSFEPNPETFRRLERRPGSDWQRLPYALSSRSGSADFYLTSSDNADSLHLPLANVRVRDKITVSTYRLDELWSKLGFTARNAFLKIDAEGHDLEVIKGAYGVLDRIPVIMVEIAPIPRFKDEPPLPFFVDFMDHLGFCVCRAEKNCMNRAVGIDTAFDMVFVKRELAVKALAEMAGSR